MASGDRKRKTYILNTHHRHLCLCLCLCHLEEVLAIQSTPTIATPNNYKAYCQATKQVTPIKSHEVPCQQPCSNWSSFPNQNDGTFVSGNLCLVARKPSQPTNTRHVGGRDTGTSDCTETVQPDPKATVSVPRTVSMTKVGALSSATFRPTSWDPSGAGWECRRGGIRMPGKHVQIEVQVVAHWDVGDDPERSQCRELDVADTQGLCRGGGVAVFLCVQVHTCGTQKRIGACTTSARRNACAATARPWHSPIGTPSFVSTPRRALGRHSPLVHITASTPGCLSNPHNLDQHQHGTHKIRCHEPLARHGPNRPSRQRDSATPGGQRSRQDESNTTPHQHTSTTTH